MDQIFEIEDPTEGACWLDPQTCNGSVGLTQEQNIALLDAGLIELDRVVHIFRPKSHVTQEQFDEIVNGGVPNGGHDG